MGKGREGPLSVSQKAYSHSSPPTRTGPAVKLEHYAHCPSRAAPPTSACVLELEVLVSKLGAVDGLTTCPVAGSEVPTL